MSIRMLQMAWRNLGRSRKRTALALMAIAVGQFALLATNGLMRGYGDNIQAAITGPMIGHVQIHDPNWRDERALDLMIEDANTLLASVTSDPRVVSAAARIYSPVLAAPEQEAFMAVIVGLQPEIESDEAGLLSGLDTPLEAGKVLVGHQLARKMQIEAGADIAVIGQAVDGYMANALFEVQAIIRCPVELVNLSGIVMDLHEAQTFLAMPDSVHEIVLRLGPEESASEVATTLSQSLLLTHLEVLPWAQLVPELVTVIKSTEFTGYFILVLVFVAAIAGIANTLMMSTFERMHEFGMLLSLGCRPLRIVVLIVLEACLVAILGVAIGTLLGYSFVGITQADGINMATWGGSETSDMGFKGLTIPMNIFPRLLSKDPLLGLVAIMITSLLASVWPAWIASRLEPVEAMRA